VSAEGAVADVVGLLMCLGAYKALARLWRADPQTVERFERRFRAGNAFHRRWMTALVPACSGALFFCLAVPADSYISGTLGTVVFVVLASLGLVAMLLALCVFAFGRPQNLIPPVVRSWSIASASQRQAL
jgi:hypothetical protein